MDWSLGEVAGLLRLVASAARRVNGGLAAPPTAGLPAGGTEVSGHRDYAPGDDIRQVDWNICARHDELVVKQYAGRATLAYHVLLDASASMHVDNAVKWDVARRCAAALAYVALDRMAPVAIYVVSSGVCIRSPWVRSADRFVVLWKFLGDLAPEATPADLKGMAAAFVQRGRPPGAAAVISDFYDPHFQVGLEWLRRKGYEPRLVQVFNPDDADPRFLGEVELADIESQQHWEAVLSEKLLRRYREAFQAHQEALRRYAARCGLLWTQVRLDWPVDCVFRRAVGLGCEAR